MLLARPPPVAYTEGIVDDATKIINDAAAQPRIEVPGSRRGPRNPFRTIEVVEISVPRCTIACPQPHRCYPEGTTLVVHPRQAQKHLQIYPGSYVLRHVKRRLARKAHGSGMEPKGHRDPREFLGDKKVSR